MYFTAHHLGKGDTAGLTAQPASGYYGDGTMGGFGGPPHTLPLPAAHSSVQNQTTVVQVVSCYVIYSVYASLSVFHPFGRRQGREATCTCNIVRGGGGALEKFLPFPPAYLLLLHVQYVSPA